MEYFIFGGNKHVLTESFYGPMYREVYGGNEKEKEDISHVFLNGKELSKKNPKDRKLIRKLDVNKIVRIHFFVKQNIVNKISHFILESMRRNLLRKYLDLAQTIRYRRVQ